MGLFSKDSKGDLYNYLDEKVDKAEVKAVCENGINEIKFMKLAINIVSNYIASAISTCEFKVYKKNELVKDINYYKLNVKPNPNDTATRLKYLYVKELVRKGSSLVVLHNNNLYFAERFGFEKESIDGNEFSNVTVQKTLLTEKFTRETSFYFKLDDEPVEKLLNEVNYKYREIVSEAAKIYRNAISNKWKLKISSAKTNDPEFQKEFEGFVTNQLKEFITSDEAVYPEMNGYELGRIDDKKDKTDSSDIRNLRKDIFDMVAQAYKMPPSMMYGNVSNLKEVANQFIAFTIKPYAKMISDEITRNFFSPREISKGSRVQVDISSINYQDIFDVAKGADKLVASGVSNIDEIRDMINLPPIDSDFSKQHWITKNYSKIEDIMDNISSPDNSSSNNSNNELKGGDFDEEQ